MWKMDGWKAPQQRAHIYDMLAKQTPISPATAVSKSPIATLIDEVENAVNNAASLCDQMNSLAGQARQANIDPQSTFALQADVDNVRKMLMQVLIPIATLRTAHASLSNMQPLAPIPGNDPMMASQEQQPPMNPMGGGM